jgi:hypothetical protein
MRRANARIQCEGRVVRDAHGADSTALSVADIRHGACMDHCHLWLMDQIDLK